MANKLRPATATVRDNAPTTSGPKTTTTTTAAKTTTGL